MSSPARFYSRLCRKASTEELRRTLWACSGDPIWHCLPGRSNNSSNNKRSSVYPKCSHDVLTARHTTTTITPTTTTINHSNSIITMLIISIPHSISISRMSVATTAIMSTLATAAVVAQQRALASHPIRRYRRYQWMRQTVKAMATVTAV